MHKCVISISRSQSMMAFILFSVTAIIFLFTSQASCSSPFKKILMEKFRKPFAAIAIASSTFLPAFSAYGGTRDVGIMATSGFIFKDTLRISAFEDPKIKGITLYLADFERPITDKLANDFFNEPSSSSLSCAQTGPINRNEVLSSISTDASGEEVFEESRNLFFKVSDFIFFVLMCLLGTY